jgi:hypothetical protein
MCDVERPAAWRPCTEGRRSAGRNWLIHLMNHPYPTKHPSPVLNVVAQKGISSRAGTKAEACGIEIRFRTIY